MIPFFIKKIDPGFYICLILRCAVARGWVLIWSAMSANAAMIGADVVGGGSCWRGFGGTRRAIGDESWVAAVGSGLPSACWHACLPACRLPVCVTPSVPDGPIARQAA